MLNDFDGKAVVITGGTKGIGLATGLGFGRAGAHVYLTHRWGSADEGEIRARFAEVGAREPTILEADASQPKETKALLEKIKQDHERVEVFLSNVAVVMRGDGVMNHKRRSLLKSLDYSSWPFMDYMQKMKAVFGEYPRYAIATSSDGPDQHYPYYDYVAVSKAVLETFCRYLATHTLEDGVHVNVVRTRQVLTDSYAQVFGEDNVELAEQFGEFAVTVDEVANTILALCSGLMDGMSGQVLLLDRGAQFIDNMMTLGPRLAETIRTNQNSGQKGEG